MGGGDKRGDPATMEDANQLMRAEKRLICASTTVPKIHVVLIKHLIQTSVLKFSFSTD